MRRTPAPYIGGFQSLLQNCVIGKYRDIVICFAANIPTLEALSASATSSELIAVSSIFTYDLYRTYFNPNASGKWLIWMSHTIVVAYALFIATFSVGLWYAGISMGYLYVMMGVIISSAVLPATLTLTWSGQNKWAVSDHLGPITTW